MSTFRIAARIALTLAMSTSLMVPRSAAQAPQTPAISPAPAPAAVPAAPVLPPPSPLAEAFAKAAGDVVQNATVPEGTRVDLLIDPLIEHMVGQNLNAQPVRGDITAEVESLVTRLSACGVSCPADRTRTITKSACAAVLGSAALLIQ